MNLKSRMALLIQRLPLDSLRLRPYGTDLATPAVRVWLGFAWAVILLMAALEGIVWGLVGASLVPQGASWLRPLAGIFLFALMFSIIWIVDASLVMSERPLLRRSGASARAAPDLGRGALLRWSTGLLVRIAIVAVSLYVTAPLLAKLIRADDIRHYHQAQVERYHEQRSAELQGQIAGRSEQTTAIYRARLAPLEAEVAQLTQALAQERERRAAIEAEYAPELAILRKDLAEAQARTGDEIFGRDGRIAGRGPEARKWETNATRLATQVAVKQRELDQRSAVSVQRIGEIERTLRIRSDELQRLRQEEQQRVDRIAAEVASQQADAAPPSLTFAERSKALQALRDSPDERGLPHFETVEGFAQAALGVLFFSLIALKLFEPSAVRAYFSETMQSQYRKYRAGGLAEIPGFELPADPARQLSPTEFARLWQAYEIDPTSFYASRQTLLELREPLLEFEAEQQFAQSLRDQRRANLDHELDATRRRRERELVAYDRELSVREQQLTAQLANETKALQNHRRIELAVQLQQAREDWTQRRTQEEEELRQRRESFDLAQIQAREELRLREKEIEQLRERSLAEIRQAEVGQRVARQEKQAELEARRQRETYQARLSGIREELGRLRGQETKQIAERQALRDSGRKIREALDAARQQVTTAEEEQAVRQQQADSLAQAIAEESLGAEEGGSKWKGFWPLSDKGADSRGTRDARKDLKNLEKTERAEGERLARLKDELHALQLRQLANESELEDLQARVTSTRTRILFYEDALATLLCPSEERTEAASGVAQDG